VYGQRLTGVWLGADELVWVKAKREWSVPLSPIGGEGQGEG
jgi:hypothetical protein